LAFGFPTLSPEKSERMGHGAFILIHGPGQYNEFAMAKTTDFKGRWALVTGASSGIGAALARELAGHGAKLILTARRTERLEALAAELAAQGTETRIVTADLNDPAAPQQIFDATEGSGLPVEILINDAGLGQWGVFHESPIDQELSQVRVNCEAMVRLSRLFVPRMVERRRGWVLMLASTASFLPVPYLSTYAATKVFNRYFALGLAAEVARFGVKVTAVCPGPTGTEFFAVARARSFKARGMQSASEVARQAVGALARGQQTVIPCADGKLIAFLVRLLPTSFITTQYEKRARPV
jgi:short-subunit dehydrogenase